MMQRSGGALRDRMTSRPVTASTQAGAIALRVIEDSRHVLTTTEFATIDLTVPDVTYQVDVGATLGRTAVDVEHAPGAERTLTARTELGSVSVRVEGS